jgi:hypothetical protein
VNFTEISCVVNEQVCLVKNIIATKGIFNLNVNPDGVLLSVEIAAAQRTQAAMTSAI